MILDNASNARYLLDFRLSTFVIYKKIEITILKLDPLDRNNSCQYVCVGSTG